MSTNIRPLAGVAGLLLVSVSAVLLLGELAIRVALPQPEGFYVYPPGLQAEFEPSSELMPGVTGTSRFVVNSRGLRGDELESRHRLRILAVGGSTTQCLYLDQSKAWPQRLQVLLGSGGDADDVWVGNAGKAGRRLVEHRLQLEHLLPAIPDLDAVVMLIGANDVNHRLSQDAYTPVDLAADGVREALMVRAFDQFPRDHALWPPWNTALFFRVEQARRSLQQRRHWQQIEDRRGLNYQRWRELRAAASNFRGDLPDLQTALDSYASHLAAALALARRHSVRIVFVTQPSIYREGLPERYERLLWMGWVGPQRTRPGGEFYATAAMARAYDSFNRRLLTFCREADAECVDLAPRMPRDTRSFYDDIHFNEAGAERVAQTIAAHFAAGSAAAP